MTDSTKYSARHVAGLALRRSLERQSLRGGVDRLYRSCDRRLVYDGGAGAHEADDNERHDHRQYLGHIILLYSAGPTTHRAPASAARPPRDSDSTKNARSHTWSGSSESAYEGVGVTATPVTSCD